MPTLLTDRTRIVSFRNCPRLRYLNFHAYGHGIVPTGLSMPLSMGSALHLVLAQLRSGADPASVIATQSTDYRAILTAALDDGHVIEEQVRLLEGMSWAWVRVRLPLIQQEYEPILIEREILWNMGVWKDSDGTLLEIVDMVRCDVIERRRADGLLFYREVKSTSTGDAEWAKQFDTSTQMLANLLAIKETLHEEVAGVIIEGVIKGSRTKDRAKSSPFFGQKVQYSPLCYLYTGPSGTSLEWARNLTKTPSWQIMDARTLVYEMLDEAACTALFTTVPPICPRPEHLERYRKQVLAQEGRIWSDLCRSTDLDVAFPMNDDHCHRYFGSPCAYKDVCFDPQIGSSPIQSGRFIPRVPHHEHERLLLASKT